MIQWCYDINAEPSQKSPTVTKILFLHFHLDFFSQIILCSGYCVFVLCYLWPLTVYMEQCTVLYWILTPCFAHVLYSKFILSIVFFKSLLLLIRVASSSMFYRMSTAIYLLFLKKNVCVYV